MKIIYNYVKNIVHYCSIIVNNLLNYYVLLCELFTLL